MKKAWKYTVFLRLLVTFLMIMTPIYAVGISIYNWGVQAIRTEITNSMIAQNTFYLNNLETEIKRIRDLQNDCIADDNLNRLTYTAITMDSFEKAQAMLRLQQRLNSILYSSRYIEEASVCIATLETTISATGGVQRGLDTAAIRSLEYPAVAPDTNIRYNDGVFYMNLANLYSKTSKAPFTYMITVRLSKQLIDRDLTQFSTYKDSITVLASGSYDYLSTYGYDGEQAGAIGGVLLGKAQGGKTGTYAESLAGKRYVVVYSTSERLGLVLARYIPETEVLNIIRNYQVWLWVFSVMSLIIIVLFSLSIYSFIHKPLRNLVWAFKKVESGDFNINIEHHHYDEFRYLYGGFNGMVKNIGTLIDQVYKQRILMQHAQLKQLQAQINPHFLYNTFFILYSMAEAEDMHSVKLFLKQLGSYFKYITRSGEDEVPLHREVEHARVYASIQELRFSKRIRVDFEELPERFGDVTVPRLIIQPILENAFKYGLEDKESDGVLTVRFRQEGSLLTAIVDDNGAGIVPEELERLARSMDNGETDGEITGILNIHRRLRLKFGCRSGLSVSNNETGGLRVAIIIDLEGDTNVQAVDRG